jgi:transcriptional regulator with XRE-family HTH domain
MKNNLAAIRKKKGYTQPELAEMTNTTKSMISMLERGDRQITQIWLERLSSALDCAPIEILYETDKDSKKSSLEIAKELEERLKNDDLLSPIIESLARVLKEREKKGK